MEGLFNTKFLIIFDNNLLLIQLKTLISSHTINGQKQYADKQS